MNKIYRTERFVSLDGEAFRRGFNDTLTLRPLRMAILNLCTGAESADDKPSERGTGADIVVTGSSETGVWHVRRAS